MVYVATKGVHHVVLCLYAKEKDGKIYPDLHKTDGRFYLTKEDAEKALQEDEYKEFKHVVEIEANLVY